MPHAPTTTGSRPKPTMRRAANMLPLLGECTEVRRTRGYILSCNQTNYSVPRLCMCSLILGSTHQLLYSLTGCLVQTKTITMTKKHTDRWNKMAKFTHPSACHLDTRQTNAKKRRTVIFHPPRYSQRVKHIPMDFPSSVHTRS